METWIEASKQALSTILRAEAGSTAFTVLIIAAVSSLFLFGKIIATHIVQSKRGWVPVFLGMLLPALIAIIRLAASDLYILDQISSKAAQTTVQFTVPLVLLLLSGVLIGRKLLDVQWIQTLIALLLTFPSSKRLKISPLNPLCRTALKFQISRAPGALTLAGSIEDETNPVQEDEKLPLSATIRFDLCSGKRKLFDLREFVSASKNVSKSLGDPHTH